MASAIDGLDIKQATGWRLQSFLQQGLITSEEIVTRVLAEIAAREPTVKAYLSVREASGVIADARALDERRRRGEPLGPLAGLPIAIKDNIAVKGEQLTCGSRILDGYIAPYDATVVEKLREQGMIFLGKTNMDEFGMGSSTENSGYQVTTNPHAPTHVPGGTSGGSAAAVAAGEAMLALGSDTGGSIRQPACLCGVVGLKPTYGLVSRYGLVAYASSLEQIGPISKDVKDAAILLDVIAGCDPKDSTSAERPKEDYVSELEQCSEDLVIGLPKEYFGEGLDDEMRRAIEAATAALSQDGFKVVEVSMPNTEIAIACYYIIATAEASSNLARYDGVRYGARSLTGKSCNDMMAHTRAERFGEEVKRRIMLGTFVLSAGYYDAYYAKAQKIRRLVQNDFKNAFQVCDVLLHPISPTPAWEIGKKSSDPIQMYLSDIYSITASLAGMPAISIPCGKTQTALPLGVQLCANHFQEKKLLQLAYHLEQLLAVQK